jgi:hypothetical protein
MYRQLMVLILFSSPGFAATLSVEADGTGEFSTVQDALLAANDGDTIEVGPGTYMGAVLPGGLGVHIRSTDGADSTILDGSGNESVLVFGVGDDADTVVEGFSLVNPGGIGVLSVDASPTLIDLHLEGLGDSEFKGGAVQIEGGSPSFENSRFVMNTAKKGGAIYVKEAQLTLKSCLFEENQAKYGGALWGQDLVWIDEGNTYDFNVASKNGGAIYLEAPFDGEVSDGRFWSNESADYGGAVWADQAPGALNFVNVDFITNTTKNSGGAVMAQSFSGPLRFEGCHFDGNDGTYDYGAAIYSYNFTDLTLIDSVFENHIGYYYGGAVYHTHYGDMTCEDTLFEDNHSGYSGGALHLKYLYSYGDARLSNCQFVGNTAAYEGGGLFAMALDDLQMENNLFQDNEAGGNSPGGGAALFDLGRTQLNNNDFVDNRAGFGGALNIEEADSVMGPHKIENNLFVENVAKYGGAVLLSGTPRSRGEITYGGTYTDQADSENSFKLIEDSTAPEGDWSVAASWNFEAAPNDYGYVVYYTPVSNFPEALPVTMRVQVFSPHEDWRFIGRLVDATGETFYGYFGDVDWTGWQEVEIPDVQAWGSWGGNDDDIFDQPVTQISLQIDADKGTKGTVRFDDVRVEIEDGSEVRLTGFEQNKWPISIINNSFITNHGLNDGGAILASDVSAEFRNNLVVATGGGQALSLLDSLSQGDWAIEYNGFFGNPGGDLPLGMEGSWSVDGDPGCAHYNQDGTLEEDRFVFLQGSPYRDAGDPVLLDPDGSASDLGANGGPLAQWVDIDEDGYSTSDDCDDGDALVHPGAEEIFYDDVNQDCTIGSDFDADGDGVEALEYGGEDCDDNDVNTQVNCFEEDSGASSTDPADPDEACSCSVQSTRALSPWAFSLAALFWRRRKRA